MKKQLSILFLLTSLIIINYLSSKLHANFDLTADKRYSVSETTKQIVNKAGSPLVIKVYLEGNFPPEFKRLQVEIIQHIKKLSEFNSNISYEFINPLGREKELSDLGLKPNKLTVQENGITSQSVIFPWATIVYKAKTENILLFSNSTNSQEGAMKRAIENLEFVFADAIYKVTKTRRKNIAILTGNDELDFIHLDGLFRTVAQYYHLEPFPLDSANVIPKKTLKLLNKFDLAIVAKPKKAFTENEKFALDQFQANGGKTLWLIDHVIAENDSLMQLGKTFALNRRLNLTDLLFNYGVRIKHNLVKDMYSATIKLASGDVNGETQYKNFLWPYYPLVTPNKNHPISKNVPAVGLKFVSTIDTLKNEIKKTVLLQSSELSKPYGVPLEINLDEINRKPSKENYNQGNQILGVLLEGEFNSAYKDRIHPFKIEKFIAKSKFTKMILISDGDIIKNDLFQGKPLDLGLDKWTGIKNGNKEFLVNSIQYLLEDDSLLKLRTKKVNLQFLDKEKVYKEQTYWKVLNISIPLIFLGIFGLGYSFFRKKKYQ